jgi:hypothetical protein
METIPKKEKKMFTKKIPYLILISSISIILAACGSSMDLTQDSTAEVSEVETSTEGATGSSEAASSSDYSYPIVDTNQGTCYNNSELIDCPVEGEAFYGQDAQFTGAAFDFTDNGDGTVTDNVTGLTWEQSPNSGPNSWPQAQEYCEALSLGGRDDWRMPSLKELFSISNFSAGQI